MPKARDVNWQKIGVARWLDRAEAAAWLNTCEQYIIEKVDCAVQPVSLIGTTKKVYDKLKLDRFMEAQSPAPFKSSKPHSTSEFKGA